MLILAEGYSQAEAAEKLHRSPNTISTLVKRAKEKLQARSPMHAILIFAKQCWLEELGEGR